MTGISAVCVNDDLTSCETTVSIWSTYYESSCWIDEELGILIDELLWKNLVEYILLNVSVDLLLADFLSMLC